MRIFSWIPVSVLVSFMLACSSSRPGGAVENADGQKSCDETLNSAEFKKLESSLSVLKIEHSQSIGLAISRKLNTISEEAFSECSR